MRIRLFTLPNLLTLANLLCGSLAALQALSFGDLTAAFWLIVAAAGFDFLDGFVARLLGEGSPLGVELDSLADDITFGFAPAAGLFVLYGRAEGLWLPADARLGVAVFLYAACAALRLAKFNVDDTQRTEFCGLPSPAAALFCASLGFLAERSGLTLPREAVLVAALGMAVLMISNVRMFALKFHGFGWRGNGLRYGFLAACLGLAVGLRAYAVPAIVGLYVLLSLIRNGIGRAVTRKDESMG